MAIAEDESSAKTTRAEGEEDAVDPEPLSSRERQVLKHIADGRSNAETASLLKISSDTVKNHVSAILGKLKARNRAHAVAQAIRKGWI